MHIILHKIENIHYFLHIDKYFYKNMQKALDKVHLWCIINVVLKITAKLYKYGGIYNG